MQQEAGELPASWAFQLFSPEVEGLQREVELERSEPFLVELHEVEPLQLEEVVERLASSDARL